MSQDVAAAKAAWLSLAYHEAGHVVVAHALGIRIDRVSIGPEGGNTDYAAWTSRFTACVKIECALAGMLAAYLLWGGEKQRSLDDSADWKAGLAALETLGLDCAAAKAYWDDRIRSSPPREAQYVVVGPPGGGPFRCADPLLPDSMPFLPTLPPDYCHVTDDLDG